MRRWFLLIFLLSYPLVFYSQNYSYDIVYQRVEIWVDPAVRYLRANVKQKIYLKKPSSVVSFDLHSSMSVKNVFLDTFLVDFVHSDDLLNINLPTELSGNLEILIEYEGVPQEDGFGGVTFSEHNGVPIVWTLTEPYGTYLWLPCKNFLGDKVDSLDLIFHIPSQYTVASNGVLVLDTVIGNERILHWKTRYPIANYLIAFAVTNYAVYEQWVNLGDSIRFPIVNFVYPEDLDYAKLKTEKVIDFMKFFSERFMVYPFYLEKYGHAQIGWSGGMEHQTITFVGGFSQSLLAHELAHHWFGDYITCGSWQEIYLNEAFATYLDGLAVEAGVEDGSWSQWLAETKSYVLSSPYGSLFVYDTSSVARIFDYRLTYVKGARFLHLIRWTVGDSAFFAGLRNYLRDSALAYGFAHTQDLKQHLEQTCNCDLTELFNDWLYGDGYPFYDIYWDYDRKSNLLKISILQQPRSTLVDKFELKLPIKVYGWERDTLIILQNRELEEFYEVPIDFEPVRLVFDPNNDLLAMANVSKLYNEEVGVILYPNPVLDVLTVRFSDFYFERLEIVDLQGRILRSIEFSEFEILGREGRKVIDVSDLKSGIYFAYFVNSTGIKVLKFIKQ